MAHSVAANQDVLTRENGSGRIVRVRQGPARWETREDWWARLRGDGSPDWFDLKAAAGLVVVKRGRDRTTWRISLPDGVVYAKVAEYAGLASRLKVRFFRDALQREWRSSLRAEARGVPVVSCVALGVRTKRRPRVVLLSEGVDSAEGLLDAWQGRVERSDADQRRQTARALIAAVSRLFAVSHDRGFVHRDAHPNNILIRWTPGEEPDARFLDVPLARLTRSSVSLRQSLPSLAQLDQYFHRCATRTDRLRFLQGYLRQRASLSAAGRSPSGLRDVLKKLRRASARHAEQLARTRDRRLRRNGPYFSTFQLKDGWRATVVLKLERRHVFPEAAIRDHSPAEWREMLEPLIERLSATRARRIALEYAGHEVEWVRIRKPWTRLLSVPRGSPHRRAFERCHKQRHRDKRNELILGYAERRRAGLIDVTMLIRPLPKERRE